MLLYIKIFLALYFVIGATVASIAMQTPWSDLGWFWICLLWPAVLYRGL